MSSVAADTHALIWYLSDDTERLSEIAFNALDQATNFGNSVYLSAISMVEIIYLSEKGRLPPVTIARLEQALDNPQFGIKLVPLDRNISVALQQIDRILVPEMPDRIIAATALFLGLPLVTRDRQIQSLNAIQTIW